MLRPALSYFYDPQSLSFEKCSIDCLQCSSLSQCLLCISSSYYLYLSEDLSLSCKPCFLMNNCQTCYFGNATYQLNPQTLLSFSNFFQFLFSSEIWNWTMICKTCASGHYLYLGDCKACKEAIADCNNCSWIQAVKKIYCYACSGTKMIAINSSSPFGSCQDCPIENCSQCLQCNAA